MRERLRIPRPGRRERGRIALRATLLQSVWNFETLQGVGFAWSLLPGLRALYPDRAERARRLESYLEVFNSNPYLATLGLGVALRIEAEVARGAAGAERRVSRLLRALRGSLGAIGDELFWAGWRPALGVSAAVVALGTRSVWPAVVFLVGFNVLAQGVRVAGVRAGYASGAGIARVLQDPFWRRATRVARLVGAAGAGAAAGAGVVWALLGGDGAGVAVFFLLVVLLGLVGLRVETRYRLPAPSLALLAALILLSALFSASKGALP
ncbi:MAG: PTS system mannose/fructose/sorbose family transporter subunit IID [Gemmatimonadota bacterium]|nr:PTS system mannose/fructose/sorbose family transporter subunit IID [Gemmatimonadota bacterium]